MSGGLDFWGKTTQSLDQVHDVFRHWLGDDYDIAALDVVLAVAAAEKLTGDPAWLLVIGGSGAAKTESLSPLAGAGAYVTSTISSEGALLSGTSKKEKSKDATGGLLRKIGESGVLVIKDVTSILSMNRDSRATVLAALREVYDGYWERNLGTDGGRTLTWSGRIVVIGAVTTAWDKAHAVVAAMGDRFLLIRLDTTTGRVGAGRQAMRNTGYETKMRQELTDAVAGIMDTIDTMMDVELTDAEVDHLLALADVVTLARTAVERDFKGDVIDSHAPEMPTRFAKQLTQVVRGGLAIGIERKRAVALATRVAADSTPPLRLHLLLDLLHDPRSTTHAVRIRLQKPRATVDRELQALHMLGLVTVDEVVEDSTVGPRTVWFYELAGDEHKAAIALLGSARNVSTGGYGEEKGEEEQVSPDISGTSSEHAQRSLDIDRLPGRCRECEFHIEHQGHATGCSRPVVVAS